MLSIDPTLIALSPLTFGPDNSLKHKYKLNHKSIIL